MTLRSILITNLFLLVSGLTFAQFDFSLMGDTSDFQKIYVGPSHEYKTLNDIFKPNWNETKSNMHIYLEEGVYSDNEIWVNTAENVIIEGMGKVELQCSTLIKNVMWISSSSNIIIKNLHMTHFNPGNPENQNCSGRVIALDYARNVLIENCDINGCGLVGVHDNLGNRDISIHDNYIHYNTAAAFGNIHNEFWNTEEDPNGIFFCKNNLIEDNGCFRIVKFQPHHLTDDTAEINYPPFYEDENQIYEEKLDEIVDLWNHNEAEEIYKENKIKHSCSGCYSTVIYLEMRLNTFAKAIDTIHIIKTYIHGLEPNKEESLKMAMIESIQQVDFSSIVNYTDNMIGPRIIRIRIGRALKC